MIGLKGLNQKRDSISLWRVFLPNDVDRDVYIKNCYLSGRISIVNEWGEVQHRVKVGRIALQLLQFPETTSDVGSEVVCVCAPYSGLLYVVEVYNDQLQYDDQDENQYRLIKINDTGISEIRTDGSGKILLTVDGEEDTDITISVTNKDRDGKLNINVNGEITIQNDGNTTVNCTNQVLINSKKILLNESDEPVLLGNKTIELLEKLLDFLAQESAGPYPLHGKANYTDLKQDLEDLLSELSFVK